MVNQRGVLWNAVNDYKKMLITHDCKHHILYEWSSKKECYEWMTWLPSPLLGMIAFSTIAFFTIGHYCPLCDDGLWYSTNVVLMPQQPSWLLQDAIPICIAIYMCILFVNWYIEIEYRDCSVIENQIIFSHFLILFLSIFLLIYNNF